MLHFTNYQKRMVLPFVFNSGHRKMRGGGVGGGLVVVVVITSLNENELFNINSNKLTKNVCMIKRLKYVWNVCVENEIEAFSSIKQFFVPMLSYTSNE